MARVLVLLAEGFEEIETSTIVDVLRRAGVEVTLAGLAGEDACRGSRGMRFVPDTSLDAVLGGRATWDLVVLPGGMGGTRALEADARVLGLVRERSRRNETTAAICAAPLVLDRAGALPEGRFTCYPGIEAEMGTPGRRDERVVDAGSVITSQGPGTALDFALHLVERLQGRPERDDVARGLLAAS